MAQPTTFHLKPLHIDDANCDACDDPGGDIDDPGGGSTDEGGSFNSFTTSAGEGLGRPMAGEVVGCQGSDSERTISDGTGELPSFLVRSE